LQKAEAWRNLGDVDDRLKILVVEDDAVYAQFVAGTLREAGHDVELVANGTAARESVKTRKAEAVMLDLMLPDENGYDLALSLRRELPSTSVIILLTAELFPQRDLADAVGIDMVLTKPVEPALVTGMVDLVRTRRRRKLEPAHDP
jgi:DNA-binding response OmpR family regulator